MSDVPSKPKPTALQLILWAVPFILSLVFVIAAFVLQTGLEVAASALLASFLYFMIRYGMHTQDSPPQ